MSHEYPFGMSGENASMNKKYEWKQKRMKSYGSFLLGWQVGYSNGFQKWF